MRQQAELDVRGTYRYKPNWWTAWGSVVVLLAAVPVLALLAPDAMLGQDGFLASLTGAGGAAFVWVMYARPRFVVDDQGVVVVGSFRSTRLRWDEVKRFDCQQSLVVVRTNGSVLPVLAMPAPGVRRVFRGEPGPVDALAARLNRRLAEVSGDGTQAEPVSVESPAGRRDIRVLAALAAAAGLVIGIARLIVTLQS